MSNTSPWLAQLDPNRAVQKLYEDGTTDVCIVGAGISGMAAAFFILENTNRSVTILEHGLLAHGATGHNAGMLYANFERPFYDIAQEFGVKLAAHALHEVEHGWELLEAMAEKTNAPYQQFVGFGGQRTLEHVLTELRDLYHKQLAGFRIDPMVVRDDVPFLDQIPKEYGGVYRLGTATEIQKLLRTKEHIYVAALPNLLGISNSALMCERILKYLTAAYPDRFRLYEHTHVRKIALHENKAIIDTGDHTVKAGNVILCTNGFENITILNHGLDVDLSFHHNVSGKIGYMAAFRGIANEVAGGSWYVVNPGDLGEDDPETGFKQVEPYIYISRRPFTHKELGESSLVAIGGPEVQLQDRAEYDPEREYPEKIWRKMVDAMAHIDDIDHAAGPLFKWHGLMGYTPTGIRIVGREPRNPVMMYSLGCNGLGIIPAISGGKRIARLLNGEHLAPSLFDPR